MGLLSTLEKKSGNTMITNISYQYESMSDDMVEQIINFNRRIYLRGNDIEEMRYCGNSRIALHDEVNDIYFFNSGNEKKQDGSIYNYYCMLFKGEFWNVKGEYSEETDQEFGENLKLDYIPEKIGRISDNEDNVRRAAYIAISFMKSKEMFDEFKERHTMVLGSESVEELFLLRDSWYDNIFASEQCQMLKASKVEKKTEVQESKIRFALKIVDGMDNIDDYKFVEEQVKNSIIVEPKICVVDTEEQYTAFKVLRKRGNNTVEENDDNNQSKSDRDYFVFANGKNAALVHVVYASSLNLYIIEKIQTNGEFDISEKELTEYVSKAIKVLLSVDYWNPDVSTSQTMEIKKIKKKIKW